LNFVEASGASTQKLAMPNEVLSISGTAERPCAKKKLMQDL
jgi:hypothetical protein